MAFSRLNNFSFQCSFYKNKPSEKNIRSVLFRYWRRTSVKQQAAWGGGNGAMLRGLETLEIGITDD